MSESKISTLEDWLKSVGYTGKENGSYASLYPEDIKKLKELLKEVHPKEGQTLKFSFLEYEEVNMETFVDELTLFLLEPSEGAAHKHRLKQQMARDMGRFLFDHIEFEERFEPHSNRLVISAHLKVAK